MLAGKDDPQRLVRFTLERRLRNAVTSTSSPMHFSLFCCSSSTCYLIRAFKIVFWPLVPVIGYRAILGLLGYVITNVAFVLATLFFYRLSVVILKDSNALFRASLLLSSFNILLINIFRKLVCVPDECTFNTIIRGFLDDMDIRRALELVSMMRSKSFAADNHTFSSLMALYTNPCIRDVDKYLLKKYFEAE